MERSFFHQKIEENRRDENFGRLMLYVDKDILVGFGPICHYKIQLNGNEHIGWGPVIGLFDNRPGCLRVETIDRGNIQYAKWVAHRDKEWIAAAMHCSVDIFHDNWHYSLAHFNCEHWARLVATGVSRCHQINISKYFGFQEYNNYAASSIYSCLG